MPTVTITLPEPHPAQKQVIREAARFNVLCCGRRWGKNVLLQDLAVNAALYGGQPVMWAAPSYRLLMDDWRVLSNTLARVTSRANASEHRLELVGGGMIDFFSLDNYDAVRGHMYGLAIMNEAAFAPKLKDAWNLAIRPTLIDLQGRAWFAGTPKGQNAFWMMYNQPGSDWSRWQMSSHANPHVPAAELEAARLTLPERVYAQEIEAVFLEDGGGVFRHVRKAATAEERAPQPGGQYAIGADWGRTEDATVFSVIEMATGVQVYIDRMVDTDYAAQRSRLKALSELYNGALCLVETNSIGGPQLEELQRMGVPVQGFVTTNASKAQIVDALSLAFERGEIAILPDDVQMAELLAFQSERLPGGTIRYGAPEGAHDDTVIALALAWWAGRAGASWVMS